MKSAIVLAISLSLFSFTSAVQQTNPNQLTITTGGSTGYVEEAAFATNKNVANVQTGECIDVEEGGAVNSATVNGDITGADATSPTGDTTCQSITS